MKVLIWKLPLAGATSPHFKRHFRDLMQEHKPKVVVLTETPLAGDRAVDISSLNIMSSSPGFTKCSKVDSEGFAVFGCHIWDEAEVGCE